MKRTKYPIHPDFKKWAKLNPPLNRLALFLVQNIMKTFYGYVRSDKTCKVKRIKIPYGDKKMKALIFSPVGIQENSPLFIYYHGGGFVLPGSPYHFHNAKKYATMANCKVLFMNYPLAPKNKFPIPVNACFEGYKWAIENAKCLSIDTERIAVGGDSAGGNIASVVSMMADDFNTIKPCCQLLLYPATGCEYETESMKKYVDTPMCNSRDYAKYLEHYLNSQDDKNQKYISPMRATSFDNFPPSYIETAEFDCLRDEAILYAQTLEKAGVEVVLNNTLGTIHGYDIEEDSEITKDSLNKRINFLKKHFNKEK